MFKDLITMLKLKNYNMSLDQIITAEVSKDSFSDSLYEIAKRLDLKTFLEIGSSSGDGSTKALVNGIQDSKNLAAKLFCMEISRPRFINLVKTYEKFPFVYPYNLSSVKISDFPSKEAIVKFYNTVKTNLNNYDLDLILQWLQQDIDYIESHKINFCGIDFVKQCNSIEFFDFVLIDGSEFTGEIELQYVWGSKVIALDDVNAYKCFAAYKRLSNHYSYKLISQDLNLRNGYAIFEKTI